MQTTPTAETVSAALDSINRYHGLLTQADGRSAYMILDDARDAYNGLRRAVGPFSGALDELLTRLDGGDVSPELAGLIESLKADTATMLEGVRAVGLALAGEAA